MEQPPDPRNTLAYRGAKFAVIVLTALIILALVGLVAGAVMKLSGRSTNLMGGSSGTAYILPPGAKILSTDTQPGRLIIHLHSAQGEEIDIISIDDGHLIRQLKTAPPAPPVRQ